MNDNNKKTYNRVDEHRDMLGIGEQIRSVAHIQDYRGDKQQAWDNPYTINDGSIGYQGLKRNEIRKGAADEYLKGIRTYYGQLTPNDVPKATNNLDRMKYNDPQYDKTIGKEFSIAPKGNIPYPSLKYEGFNDDDKNGDK